MRRAVRPDVVWFGEAVSFNFDGLSALVEELCQTRCVHRVGTSAQGHPRLAPGPNLRSGQGQVHHRPEGAANRRLHTAGGPGHGDDEKAGRRAAGRVTPAPPATLSALAAAGRLHREAAPGVPLSGIFRTWTRNAHWSAISSMAIEVGLPAPWPARVSIRTSTGASPTGPLGAGGDLTWARTTRSSVSAVVTSVADTPRHP